MPNAIALVRHWHDNRIRVNLSMLSRDRKSLILSARQFFDLGKLRLSLSSFPLFEIALIVRTHAMGGPTMKAEIDRVRAQRTTLSLSASLINSPAENKQPQTP